MIWLLSGLVVAILAGAAVAGSGRLGSLPPVVHDAPVPELPEGGFTPGGLRGVTFATTLTGYDPAQVADVLEHAARSLEQVCAPSAIMDPIEFSQSGREGEHGSNEAPHG
ncbi:MAG: DivIVA domain-containing protein [Propionibacteriaceae bacterium]|nr:DivIVA domain-containing protein [Propionibacteriaceae bacterium]